MKTLFGVLKIIIPLSLGIYLAWFSIDSIENKDKVLAVLSEANYFLIFLSVVFSWLSHFSRSLRWKYMLEPMGYTTSVWSNYHSVMTGYFMNLLIPRAGEISRAGLISRLENVSVDKAIGTIVAERVIDVIMLASISLVTIFMQYDVFLEWREKLSSVGNGTEEKSGTSWLLLIGAGVVLLMVVFIVVILKSEKVREKARNFIKGLSAGMLSVVRLKKRAAFIFHTFLIWFLYILLYVICFYSIDETTGIPLRGLMLGFLAGSIGIIFVPGGIGVYPLLVAGALGFYGADYDIVIALGWIVWAAQTLLLVVAGAVSFYLVSGKAAAIKKENHS